MNDPANPSGRVEIGGSGSPAPSTTRPGDSEWGIPDGAFPNNGPAETSLSDVDRPGIGKSGTSAADGAALGTVSPFLPVAAAGAFAVVSTPARAGCAGCAEASRRAGSRPSPPGGVVGEFTAYASPGRPPYHQHQSYTDHRVRKPSAVVLPFPATRRRGFLPAHINGEYGQR